MPESPKADSLRMIMNKGPLSKSQNYEKENKKREYLLCFVLLLLCRFHNGMIARKHRRLSCFS